MDTRTIIEKNKELKDDIGWDRSSVMKAIGPLNINVCVDSERFINLVKNFQRKNNLREDGLIGPSTWEAIRQKNLSPKERAIKTIIEPTVKKESGSDSYWAMNKDGEFRGLFDDHRAEGEIHIGLSFGFIQFTQDSGSLGRLLKKSYEKNETKFKNIFGSTYQQLLYVTNKEGPSGLETDSLRGPRVKPVPVIDNKGIKRKVDIWKEPWVSKFKEFGKEPAFQAVQRQLAVEDYLKPILSFLEENDMLSQKEVAAGFSASVHRGPSGARYCRDNYKCDLEQMSEADSRYDVFIQTDLVSWDKWEGWQYFN